MKVIRKMCPKSKSSIKCPYEMKPEFIVVHNTGNNASARNEVSYMINNNNKVSFHYAIDDKEIVQGIEETRNTWNCGDGTNGKGNRKGISIEICYSTGDLTKFKNAEVLTAKFIAVKLKEKKWGIDKVKKHQDFSKKYCPHKTLDLGWNRFLDLVRFELKKLETANTNSKYVLGKYKVNATKGLNVRKSPINGSIVKAYNNGATIDIKQINGSWGLTKDGWCCLDYCIFVSK